MQLPEYESAKFQLAEILRALDALTPAPITALEDSIRELFIRLAEDRFNLVVAGRFNRGKTSLMNAILGLDRLPTGILPLTSVITRVYYGSHERVAIDFETHGLPSEISMDSLRDYVTQDANPGNRKRIRQARIELPAEILRRGFHFIDTPGLGSAIAENTRTTEQFLPEADAVVLVSGCDSPVTDEELRLILFLSRDKRKLFIVLNKHDLIPPEAREDLAQFAREQLVRSNASPLPSLYLVSARDGLLGKLRGDAALLESSGLQTLENALIDFLTQEKREVFLRGMLRRLDELLDDLAATQELDPIALQNIHLRLNALDAAISPDASERIRPSIVHMDSPGAGIARIDRCDICSRVVDEWFEYLRHKQHDLAVNADERVRFAQNGGFCDHHMRQYASIAGERDLCLALTPLLERVGASLAASGDASLEAAADLTAAWLSPSECALCDLQGKTETSAFTELAQRLQEHADVPSAPPSICLPHLRRMARQDAVTSSVLGQLLRQQGAAVQRLAEDTQRYVLKRDALRHRLTNDEEDQAGQMAIMFLAAHPKVIVMP